MVLVRSPSFFCARPSARGGRTETTGKLVDESTAPQSCNCDFDVRSDRGICRVVEQFLHSAERGDQLLGFKPYGRYDEFGEWWDGLSEEQQEDVAHVVDLLRGAGVLLKFPHSSALEGTKKEPLRELRPRQGRSPLRVVYAFDPQRDAVLLLGSDKGSDPRFYERIIPRAERIWKEYLAEQAKGLHKEQP